MSKSLLSVIVVVVAGLAGFAASQSLWKSPETTNHLTTNESSPQDCPVVTDPTAQVAIKGGTFTMGASDFYPEEAPLRDVRVDDFSIDRFEVTNAQFAAFIAATGYVTVAERTPDPTDYPDIPADMLRAGSAVFVAPSALAGGDLRQWWTFVAGADWRHPVGPDSNIDELNHHPVVHIAFEDAQAYADWAGRALPTEAQWEYAARGGLINKVYAWGEQLRPGGRWQANTWQGQFPIRNSADDGHVGTAPVGCFPANQFGVHDLIGNVWEWTTDWYFDGAGDGTRRAANDPTTRGFDPRQPGVPVKAIKGGSFLCSDDYCVRYRPAARQAQDVTFSASHIGFRTVSVSAD